MGRPGVQGMLERRGTHALRSGVGGLQHFSDRHTRIRADSPMRRHGRGGRGARRARRAPSTRRSAESSRGNTKRATRRWLSAVSQATVTLCRACARRGAPHERRPGRARRPRLRRGRRCALRPEAHSRW